jgi:hypothetical protein
MFTRPGRCYRGSALERAVHPAGGASETAPGSLLWSDQDAYRSRGQDRRLAAAVRRVGPYTPEPVSIRWPRH